MVLIFKVKANVFREVVREDVGVIKTRVDCLDKMVK